MNCFRLVLILANGDLRELIGEATLFPCVGDELILRVDGREMCANVVTTDSPDEDDRPAIRLGFRPCDCEPHCTVRASEP